MDPPQYSDPVVIPFSFTVPDPRPRHGLGRWDGDGLSLHPSFNDPDWFRRQGLLRDAPVVRAQFLAPFPRWAPVPIPLPGEVPSTRGFKEAVERARRRAQEVEREFGRGEYGSALGSTRKTECLEHHPTERDHPSDKGAHGNKSLERQPCVYQHG